MEIEDRESGYECQRLWRLITKL